ncbi:thyroglobulin-like, partial [Amphibalanus amphitrite]|uniref:thyroglobulin-like n=1 Tax=Amphibalanus amphitrite TaxID=1232801 RepID=UPI001C919597
MAVWWVCAPLCGLLLLAAPSVQQYQSDTPCLDARSRQGPTVPGQRYHDCDADGQFRPQQCVGSVCFCVDTLGEQMKQFEAVGRHEAHLVSCACARQKTLQAGRHGGQSVTCDRHGNFAPRQCVGSQCHCVDPLTGQRRDELGSVHVSQIGQLRCGDEGTDHGSTGQYGPPQLDGETRCWDELRAHEQRSAGGGLLGASRPDCDRLGRYKPTQCRGSKCYCVKPDGERLTQYEMAPRERPLYCGCARRVHEISESGLVGVILSCDEHGDYDPRQCVGSVCHCADTVTGEKHRGSVEVPIHRFSTLDCSAHGHRQNERPPLGSNTPCWDELRQHEERSEPLLGAEKPNCDRTGRYHPKQCK